MAKPESLDPAKMEERRAAMMSIVGIWKDRTDLPDTETYIRNLRDGDRLDRLLEQWRRDDDVSSPFDADFSRFES